MLAYILTSRVQLTSFILISGNPDWKTNCAECIGFVVDWKAQQVLLVFSPHFHARGHIMVSEKNVAFTKMVFVNLWTDKFSWYSHNKYTWNFSFKTCNIYSLVCSCWEAEHVKFVHDFVKTCRSSEIFLNYASMS